MVVLFAALTTIVLAICVSAGTAAAVSCVLDAHLRFSQGMLAALFLIWLVGDAAIRCGSSAGGWRGTIARSKRPPGAWRASFPNWAANLINLVQLSEDGNNADSPFREAAVAEAASQVEQVAFDAAAKKQSRWQRLLYCMQTPRDLAEVARAVGVLVAVAVVYCKAMIPNLGSAANRLLTPWSFVPSVGKAGKIDVKPGDAEVILGGSLEITAEHRQPAGRSARRPLVRPARRRSGNGHADDRRTGCQPVESGQPSRLETCPTRPPSLRFSSRFATAWKSAIRSPRRFASPCARSRWWPRSA